MKKSPTRISANEMNRYMYCKNQWYYKRVYGAKALKEMYDALEHKPSEHPEYFKKGLKHHRRYHLRYGLIKALRIFILALIIGFILISIIKGVNIWN
nr:hypothetical protein [uncultured Niameybacter sp.]